MDKKKNTFRDEVESSEASPTNEMNRNQAVHLVTLRSEKEMLKADREHLRSQRNEIVHRRTTISLMADCECKAASIAMVEGRIEKLNQAIEASQFNGISEMTLDVLERLAALTAKTIGGASADEVGKT